MAEVIGLAASVAGLLQLAGQVVKLSYAYVSDVRNAPKFQKLYLQEVSAFMDVLFRAEQAILDAESTGHAAARPTSLTSAVIQDCHAELSKLQLELEKQTRRLLWPFQEKELKKSIEILGRFRTIFADYVSATVLTATNATYKKLEALTLEQDKHQLLAWLESQDAPPRARPRPCSGTGQQFLTSPEYAAWRDGPSMTLWCCGSPGVGKSHLASLVIADLQTSVSPRPTVLSFFADFSVRRQYTTLEVIRGLLRQAIEQGDSGTVAKAKEACGGDPSQLRELDSICAILADVCSVSATYLVLDAPDELEKPDELLRCLKQIASTSVRLLIMSREMAEIKRRFSSAIKFEVKTDHEDVRRYVNDRIEDSEYSEELSEAPDLVNELVSKYGEIFLVAKLMLDQMLEHSTIKKMRKCLDSYPPSIEGAYEANLGRIDSQPKLKRELARRLLSWVTNAARRLRTDEILDAFAVEDDVDEIDPENILSIERLLAPCFGLVMVDPIDQTVGLIHTSAYEYFQSRCDGIENAHGDIARTSLLYLSLKPLKSGRCLVGRDMESRIQEMPFLRYSATQLASHISSSNSEEELTAPIQTFLGTANLISSAFQALQFPEHLHGDLAEEFLQSIPTGQSALHIAACWNLKGAAARLVDQGQALAPLDSQEWSPLHYACSTGNFAVANILVSAGAPVNLQDSQGWTPLFWAAFSGSQDIVDLLLDNSANHLIQSTLGWTALHWAVARGEEDIVSKLLQHHRLHPKQPSQSMPLVASLTFDEAVGYTKPNDLKVAPIELAADSGRRGIFDILSVECTEVKLKNNDFNRLWAKEDFQNPVSNPWRTILKGGGTPYAKEMKNSFRQAVRRSAIQATEHMSETIIWKSKLLLSAITEGQLTAARLLVSSGANANFNDRTTPLHAAAFREDPAFCELLLLHGADTSAVDYRGYTALHQAVMNGFYDTAAALLRAGADPNVQVVDTYMYVGVVLLDHQKFPSANKTPLILACGPALGQVQGQDWERLMELLLSSGADPNGQDDQGMTALHYLATVPDLSAMRLLMRYGASPDVLDLGGRSPLHLLAKHAADSQSRTVIRDAVNVLLLASRTQDQVRLVNQTAGHPEVSNGGRRQGSWYAFSDWDEDNGKSPTAMALENGRWTVFDVLVEKGGHAPTSWKSEPVLKKVIAELDHQRVSKVLDLGAKPEPSAIWDLTWTILGEDYWGHYNIHCAQFKVKSDSGSLAAYSSILADLLGTSMPSVDFRHPDNKTTALHMTARAPGAPPLLRHLLAAGADPGMEVSPGMDAFILAALYQNTDQLRCLTEHAIKEASPNHWTRHLAELESEGNDYDKLCAALELNGDIDRMYGSAGTLLHLAAELDNSLLVSALLSHRASKHVVDHENFAPIHYAVFKGAKGATKLLWPPTTSDGLLIDLTMPENSNQFEKLAEEPPTEEPKEPPEEQRAEQRDTSTQAVLPANKMLLHYAIEQDEIQMVTDLLDLGVSVDQSWKHYTEECHFPLYLAAELGHTSIVRLLLSRGADVNRGSDQGWTALHKAALEGREEVVRVLLDSGADVHATTTQWGTNSVSLRWFHVGKEWCGQALHLAAWLGHVGVVRLLLEHGADVTARAERDVVQDNFARPAWCSNALHYALSTDCYVYGRGENLDGNRLLVARMLIEAGASVEGVADEVGLADVAKFKGFEDVWETVRLGVTAQGRKL